MVFILAWTAAPAAAAPRDGAHDAAIALSRAGHREEAIAQLKALLATGTRDETVALDLAVLLQQAGRPSEAIAVYERLHPKAPPSYALASITRAYRDTKQFAAAEARARSGRARFPQEPIWPVLLALVLADESKAEEALAVLATKAAQQAPESERLLAHAYALRRQNLPFDALRDYFTLLSHDPKNADARNEAIVVLRQIRASHAAAALAETPALPLAADLAAAQVRWGTDDAPSEPKRRFVQTDRALATLDSLIARAKAEGDSDTLLRLRFDRIVAYRDRVRMADAAAEAETLQKEGHALAPYVREAYADALLYLRRPQEARAQYETLLTADPHDRNSRVGRIYACVEMEDFGCAFDAADALLEDEPLWNGFAGDPSRYANESYVDAALLAAAVRNYADQPDEAWQRLRPMLEGAPRNPFIVLGAASIMSARQKPRLAEEENRIALSLSPSLLPAQIAVAESALARDRYEEAETRADALAVLYPENRQVQRFEDEVSAQTGWQISAEIRPSNEKGGGAFGNSGNEINAAFRAASPLIEDGVRAFAGYTYSDSHPSEGFVNWSRVSLGAQASWPDWSASAAVTESFGTLQRTGFTGLLDWSPTDEMALALAGERISSETPLRALLHGTTADSLSARFTYTWDQTSNASVGASWLPFTDGNERATADLRYTWRAIAIPHFDLNLTGALYGSTNSLANTQPYYNPASDGSATLRIEAEHMLWRHYETSWVQALTLEGGFYGENGFKGGAIGTVTYEQRWRFDPWAEVVYGASISARMYDGAGATVIGGFLTLSRKF